MTAPPDEPSIPVRAQRPLAAVWISLGLHAAVIALVQVAPPATIGLSGPVIEARLGSVHAATSAVAPPASPSDVLPLLAPSESAESVPVTQATALPEPAQAAAQPVTPAVTASPVVPATTSPLTIASAVDLTYYSARDLDVQPRALREIVPGYPADADQQRLSGKVRLQLKLEADGRVSDIDVVSATPPGVFDESAIRAFREARFAPAQKNGHPVRARVLIEVTFDWEGRPR